MASASARILRQDLLVKPHYPLVYTSKKIPRTATGKSENVQQIDTLEVYMKRSIAKQILIAVRRCIRVTAKNKMHPLIKYGAAFLASSATGLRDPEFPNGTEVDRLWLVPNNIITQNLHLGFIFKDQVPINPAAKFDRSIQDQGNRIHYGFGT